MNDEQFKQLKLEIESTILLLNSLQSIHRNETGKNHVPELRTDVQSEPEDQEA